MQLPFTIEQFLNVFVSYNQAIFPMQIVTYLLAVIALTFCFKRSARSDGIISTILGFFWLFMGIFYHLLFFSAINKGAYIFGIFLTCRD